MKFSSHSKWHKVAHIGTPKKHHPCYLLEDHGTYLYLFKLPCFVGRYTLYWEGGSEKVAKLVACMFLLKKSRSLEISFCLWDKKGTFPIASMLVCFLLSLWREFLEHPQGLKIIKMADLFLLVFQRDI